MGKYNMDAYQTLYLGDPDQMAFLSFMAEDLRKMMRQVLGGDEQDKPGPRDWSPRTGRCLCQKRQA